MATIDLGAQGLTNGGDVSGHLDQHLTPGNTVIIPDGTYSCSDLNAFECDGGAVLTSDGHATIDFGSESPGRIHVRSDHGEMVYENVTLEGRLTGKGGFKVFQEGSDIYFRNFNVIADVPDGDNYIGFLHDHDSYGDTTHFHNCRIEGFTNNGIYSNRPGQDLDVQGCIIAHNNIDQIRIFNGTIEGCLFLMEHRPPLYAARTGRAIRQKGGGTVEIRNNNFIYTWSGAESCYVSVDDERSHVGRMRDATTIIENNRFRHDGDRPVMRQKTYPGDLRGGGNHITGSNTDVHSGFDSLVACAGSGCTEPDRTAPGGSGGGTPDPTPDLDHTAVFDTVEGSGNITYQFIATGEVQPGPNAETGPGDNDSVTATMDGFAVEGVTGNGLTDDWEFNGEITEVNANAPESDWTLRVDGNEWTPPEPDEPEPDPPDDGDNGDNGDNGDDGNGGQPAESGIGLIAVAGLLGAAIRRARDD